MKNLPYLTTESAEEKQKKRYHMSVEFFSSPLKMNLFDVYQICDLACSSNYKHPEHKQLCYEISYIVSGEGTFIRNGISYTVYPNTIFFVNKDDTHAINSSKNNPLRYMCLGFTFHKDHASFEKYEQICSFFDNLQNPLVNDNYKVFDLFTSALNEITSLDSLSLEMLEAYVLQIIIQTYRNFSKQPRIQYKDFLNADDTNPIIYEIIHYIDSNLTNINKLSDLSKVFDYSYGYLSKTFSQVMGITIKDYYTQRRFEKAVEMLADNVPIATISETLLFADVPTFCKAFKHHFHLSPKKYQELNRVGGSD